LLEFEGSREAAGIVKRVNKVLRHGEGVGAVRPEFSCPYIAESLRHDEGRFGLAADE
jgi:hypothetical protein